MLDVDVCGPSIPVVMGLEGEQVHQSGSGWSPVVRKNLLMFVGPSLYSQLMCACTQNVSFACFPDTLT